MSSVDDRIVNMQFNNKQFVQGASDSKRSLDELEKALQNTGKGSGLSTMGSAVDAVSSKFSLLKVAGISAVATIASKATTSAINMVKAMSLDPIMDGFREYTTNLNSIQVIMSNTGAKVNVVNKYLNNLNHYSDQTIYNFAQMADSIGKFTAAGVKLPAATSAIKGMANAAALSGANAMQLNSAMYQMSQALASGTIKLMDWNSLVNANMGGQNLQNALKQTAESMDDNGVAMKAAIEQYGTFRDSLTSGWLTADIYNKAMEVMAGTTDKATGKTVAYSVAQLRSMGYTKEAAVNLHELSGRAIEAATKIKTLPQLLDVVKESIGSGWAKIFQDLFGNFDQASKLWTNVGNSITGVISNIFGSIDSLLVQWRKAGGYTAIWAGFGNIFKALGNLIQPFIAAFKTLLPTSKAAGSTMADASKGFEAVTGWIEKATRGASAITPILVTLFGAFKTGGQAIGAVVRGLAPLASIFTNLASSVGDMAKQGIGIGTAFVDGLLQGIDFSRVQSAVVNFANSVVEWVKSTLGIHSPSTVMAEVGLNIVQGLAEGLLKGLGYIGENFGKIISTIFEYVTGLFDGFDALDFAALFNSILTGGLIYAILQAKKTLTTFRDVLGSIVGVIDEVGNSLKAWQNSLKAKMIMEIAIAIGILTASVIALSFVEPKKIAIGLGAIATMMGILSGTLLALSKIKSDKQMAVLATSLLLISAAMIQFAAAIRILGSQDMKTLEKGLGSFAIILSLVTGSLLALSAVKGTAAGNAAAVVAIATAVVILSGAVLAFGKMDLKTLGKGLGAMAIGLGLLTASLLALSLTKGVSAAAGASMIMMATAMTIVAGAVLAFGKMNLKTLAKGLGAMAISMTLMTVALIALGATGPAVLAGGAAMVLLAGAMLQMAAVIGILGSMSFDTLKTGILALAAALAVFIIAGAAAAVVAPGLLALGVSIGLIGAGMFLAGVGVSAFAAGLAVLATVGTAATGVIIAAIHAFLALLPEIAQQGAAAFVAFIKVIANASGEIRTAFGKIFRNILGVITDNIPAVGRLFSKLIETGLKVIRKAIPDFVETGLTLIQKFLASLAKHVPDIADNATDLVIAFVEAIGRNSIKMVKAAAQMLVDFINGLSDAIDTYAPLIRGAMVKLAVSIIDGLTGGLLSWGVQKVKDAIAKLTDYIPGWAKKMLGINSPAKVMIPIGESIGEGIAVGVTSSLKAVLESVSLMADKIIAAGSAAVLEAAKAATKAQKKAYEMQAKADLAAEAANDAAKFARQHKKDKAAQKRAKELQKQADAAQKAADKAQNNADKANQHVTDVQTFENASLNEKGNIKDAQAVALADRSEKMLAKANAEAKRARELMKTNQKAGRAMLEQAKKDREAAKDLEKKARAAHKAAQEYYAKEVEERIKSIEDEAAAEKKAAADQAAYDAADTQGKADILKKRAAEQQAIADAQNAKAEELIAEAKRLADTDAIQAMKLLDEADAAKEAAKAAADQAASDLAQAQQVLGESSSASSATSVKPSQSVLEQAASVIDRYTASLQQATDLAQAQQTVVQFNQHNNSPESLSPSEIYRQTKNLLSAAEIKMGA